MHMLRPRLLGAAAGVSERTGDTLSPLHQALITQRTSPLRSSFWPSTNGKLLGSVVMPGHWRKRSQLPKGGWR